MLSKQSRFKQTRIRYIVGSILSICMMMAVALAIWQLPQTREFFGQASGTPAAIVVFTKSYLGPLPRPWRNLSQGGEDHAWRLKPVSEPIAALNPEYIRLDHIYDFYDVVGGTSGNFTFDFSKLDLVLNDIADVGATPYISLSYMPSVLNDGDIVGEPNSYADWQLVVQKTIEHISGNRKTPNVYYEVWNEPDLFGSWKYYGEKNYLDLYAAAARGAALAAPRTQAFKLGGAATTALYKNWFDALATKVTQDNLRFDFFSWHRYTKDPEVFEQDIQHIQEWVTAYPQLDGQIEYHITEWGLASELDSQYDNAAGAAHVVAGAITLVNPFVRSFVFEIQDGKDPQGAANWGRWGLLQHSDFGSVAKPRYWGLRLLDQLPEQRLQLSGQGTWVKAVAATPTEENKPTLVIANYDAAGAHSETVPITFVDIEPGSYLLSVRFLSGKTNQFIGETQNNSITFNLFMPPHSVVFATLSKTQPVILN